MIQAMPDIVSILQNSCYTQSPSLIILWLLGLVTSYTLGGVIHVLVVIAIIMIIINFISGGKGPK
jgi:Family of unknown function (DUF5670)